MKNEESCANSETKYSSEKYNSNPEKECVVDDQCLVGKLSTNLRNTSCIEVKTECEEDGESCKLHLLTNEEMLVTINEKNICDSMSVVHRYDKEHSSNEFIRGVECQEFPILKMKEEEVKADKQIAEIKNYSGMNDCQVDGDSEEIGEYRSWSHSSTRLLIDAVKEKRNDVGTKAIRNKKLMWEAVASHLTALHGMNVTRANCENRWKVLLRNYKRFVENNRSTGRGRKDFEYAAEMDAIFLKQRNIHSKLVLSSSTIHNGNPSPEPLDINSARILPVPSVSSPPYDPKRLRIEKQRVDQREEQQQKELELEERKMLLEERKLVLQEKIYDLQVKKLEAYKRRNDILEEGVRKNLLLPNSLLQ